MSRNAMGKGHLPVIAKAQNQMLGEISILGAIRDADTRLTAGGVDEHYVAEIYCGPQPLPTSREMLVRLRDQISAWLSANPAGGENL